MLNQFRTHIEKKLPFLKESRILIAISGGLDSVVLTHLCHSLKFDIALAHCNFNLRASESDTDEQFVLDLAETLNLEVFIQNFDTKSYAKEHKLSTQMAARELRYYWFNELAEQLNYDYILTAHHADDNLETFLINLSRGSGLDGLTGIPEQNHNIIRPLLPFTRVSIEAFAKEAMISWREDASNASSVYLRNALRHQVVPKLKELKPQILQNFQKTISHLQDTQSIINDRIDEVAKAVISNDMHGNLVFNISEIKQLSNPKAYLYQLLQDYGFTEWNDVADLLTAQSGKQISSSTHRLIKNRNELILSFLAENNFQKIKIEIDDQQVKLPQGILAFDKVEAISKKRSGVTFVDKDLLKFPLTVRGWQEGDYFYPSGMTGKKKLSKYFKDEKLSLLDKENSWLLCSEHNIVCIINQRQDNRYIVTDQTKNILRITYTK